MTTYVERLFSAVSNALEFNAATLSGAADIIVVEGEDGVRRSIPWNVRFGKLRLLKSREKVVNVVVNDEPCDIVLTLDTAGEAYFLAETDQPPPPDLVPSPVSEPSSPVKHPISSSVSPELLSKKLQESGKPYKNNDSSLYPIEGAPLEGKDLVSYSSDSEFDMSLRNINGTQEIKPSLQSCKLGSQDDLTLGMKNKKLSAKLTNFHGGAKRESFDNSFFVDRNKKDDAYVDTENYSSSSALSGQSSESINIASSNLPNSSSSIASSPASWMDSFLRRFTNRKELHHDVKTSVVQSDTQEDHSNAPLSSLISSSNQDKVEYNDCYPYLSFDDLGDSVDNLKPASERTHMHQPSEVSCKMLSDGCENQNTRELLSCNTLQKKEHSAFDTWSTCSSSETEPDELICVPDSSSRAPEEPTLNSMQHQRFASKQMESYGKDDGKSYHSTVSVRKQDNSKYAQHQEEDLSKSHKFFEGSQEKETFLPETDYPIALSLCGHLIRQEMPEEVKMNIFEHNRVAYHQFSSDPSILSHPNLLVRVGGKLMKWKDAAPLIVSILAFATPLDSVNGTWSQKKRQENKEDHGRKRFSWFGFRSSDGNISGEPLITDDMIAMVEKESAQSGISESGKSIESSTMDGAETKGKKFLIKTRRPSKEELGKLPLRPGMNVVRFVVNSTLQGVQELSSRIFLWSYDSKIVVSDVDGTITKSDVLGHLLPRVGKDWSHEGIAKLYTLIARNGYKMVYLTSRAIGQATSTRAYIQSLYQDSKYSLPEGPIVMSPDRLVESLTREVIRKRPQEFKIVALRNVKELFADGYNAFYAGFGNRYTDFVSYRAVGIRSNRIFLINWKGELQICNYVYETVGTYRNLQQFVDQIFRDISLVHGTQERDEVLQEDEYNDWNYWKPNIEV